MQQASSQKPYRLAHISDLHFSKISFNPMQFFSKRWIGNGNLILRRAREFNHDKVLELIDLFKIHEVDGVLISGDLSTTSLTKEFEEASSFIQHFAYAGIEVLTLPGNHDTYTKKAAKEQTFYDYFPSYFSRDEDPLLGFNLKEHKITVKKLSHSWWVVLLDTTLCTSLLSCHGVFSDEIKERLKKVLSAIPASDSVIVANHFPLFSIEKNTNHLQHDEELRSLLSQYKNVKAYLHGHTHRHCIADLRNAGLPIVMDSGSVAHNTKGSCNLLNLTTDGCEVTVFQWKTPVQEESGKKWTEKNKHSFTW